MALASIATLANDTDALTASRTADVGLRCASAKHIRGRVQRQRSDWTNMRIQHSMHQACNSMRPRFWLLARDLRRCLSLTKTLVLPTSEVPRL